MARDLPCHPGTLLSWHRRFIAAKWDYTARRGTGRPPTPTTITRVPGTTLNEGRIFQRDVLRFRSFVAHEMRRGRVVLVGDAAHTVPPTGAKGMNLAVADVVLLTEALRALLLNRDETLLDAFPEAAQQRIWKAQHFSWWMTNMLHLEPGAGDFDRLLQIGELRSVVESRAGRTYLAEAYTGWPL